jgi:hypothetical protein
MDNIKTSLKGSILTVEIDVSKVGNPSSSGKSLNVATTGGAFTPDGTDVQLNINCYRPLPKAAKK